MPDCYIPKPCCCCPLKKGGRWTWSSKTYALFFSAHIRWLWRPRHTCIQVALGWINLITTVIGLIAPSTRANSVVGAASLFLSELILHTWYGYLQYPTLASRYFPESFNGESDLVFVEIKHLFGILYHNGNPEDKFDQWVDLICLPFVGILHLTTLYGAYNAYLTACFFSTDQRQVMKISIAAGLLMGCFAYPILFLSATTPLVMGTASFGHHVTAEYYEAKLFQKSGKQFLASIVLKFFTDFVGVDGLLGTNGFEDLWDQLDQELDQQQIDKPGEDGNKNKRDDTEVTRPDTSSSGYLVSLENGDAISEDEDSNALSSAQFGFPVPIDREEVVMESLPRSAFLNGEPIYAENKRQRPSSFQVDQGSVMRAQHSSRRKSKKKSKRKSRTSARPESPSRQNISQEPPGSHPPRELQALLLVRRLPVHKVAYKVLGFLRPAAVEKIFPTDGFGDNAAAKASQEATYFVDKSDGTVCSCPTEKNNAFLTITSTVGSFQLTQASRLTAQAIATTPLYGTVVDWGCGGGVLALLAASQADRVIGLDYVAQNITTCLENARQNGLEQKTEFYRSDSFQPFDEQGKHQLEELKGQVDFLIANPPASTDNDGFSFRRRILKEAMPFLKDDAQVLLQALSHYGPHRFEQAAKEASDLRNDEPKNDNSLPMEYFIKE